MNSMLQCMSNTMEMTDFFLDEDQYIPQINSSNKLGSGGKLAHAYAALLQAMWCGMYARAAPSAVKEIVARKCPQFVGWGQQDSQEFMSSFMDLLLEDTCRVPVKPSVENPDCDGRSEASVADESWGNYLKRNDSKIAEVFAGQFRSHVQCNVCERISITFDPFTCFSVPLPIANWTKVDMFYFGNVNHTPVIFTYYYRKPEPPSIQQLADWLASQIAAERVANPTSPIAAQPAPHELLFTLTTASPCVIRSVLPHWANLGSAFQTLSKTIHSRMNVMVWHIEGVQPYNSVSAPGAMTEDDVVEDWPIDYVEVDPSSESNDDDDFAWNKPRKEVKYKESVPGLVGPHMKDFVAIWCRHRFSQAGSFVAAADSLIVPTKLVDETGARAMSNNQFREAVWTRVRRLLKLPADTTMTAATAPYRLSVFNYVYERRKFLPNDYERNLQTEDFIANDDVFLPKNNMQFIVDFDFANYREFFDSEESKVGAAYSKRACHSDPIVIACSALYPPPLPAKPLMHRV
jgi:hypothetical protein